MFKFHFKRAVVFGLLGLLTGFLIAQFSTPIFEANAEVLVGEPSVSATTATLSPDVQRILEVGQANTAQTELQVLRSQSVFFQALQNVAREENSPDLIQDWVRLYLMYDVLSPETRAATLETGSVATIRVRVPGDRDLAQAIAQQVIRVYNDLRVQNARTGLQNAIRYLSAQEQSSRTALEQADTRFKQFATDREIVNIDFATQSATQLEANALQRLQEARAQFSGAQAEVTALEQEVSRFPDRVDGGTIDTKPQPVVQVEAQITELEQQLSQLRTRYYDDHPRVQEVLKSLENARGTLNRIRRDGLETSQRNSQLNPIRQTLEQQLANARSRADNFSRVVAEAESSYNEVKQRLRNLPNDEAQIRQLQRELDVADLNFRRVKQQIDELRSREGTAAREIPVLSDARAFEQPVAPDRAKFIFIGFIAGLCIGLIYSFSVEAMKLRVHTSTQLSDLTGLPVVATMPALPRSKQRTLTSLTQVGASPSESFRNMAYTFLAKGHDLPRTMLFTGVGTVPGRASGAVQFAIALASTGHKVILVDCDPVRGAITKAFGAEGQPGVSDVFDRNTLPSEGSDVLVSTQHANLSLLPVGSDPTKTLADRPNQQLEDAVAYLRSRADVVVFDVPPCDMYSDASRIAALMDEVCMVVSANTTNYAQVPNGYEILHRAGAKDVSLILTDASPNDEPFGNTQAYGARKKA